MKKNDISSRRDIELLVDDFYNQVRKDAILGSLFENVYKINWNTHIPVMYDFWENVLLHTGNYAGNPMQVHLQLHLKHPLKSVDFSKWINLFIETVDLMYEGEQAEKLKQHAKSIALVMHLKLFQ